MRDSVNAKTSQTIILPVHSMATNRLHDNLLIVSPEVIWVLKPIAPSKTTRKYNIILKTLPMLVCAKYNTRGCLKANTSFDFTSLPLY